MSEKFIIDSNSIINPYQNYYPFDLVPGFWEFVKKHIENGDIYLLDRVKSEISTKEDDLAVWIKSLENVQILKSEDHLASYSEVLTYVQKSPCYTPNALAEWSKINVADPWLIAAAIDTNYTLITFEKRNSGLNSGHPSKNAKIPDVADQFDVKIETLFYMLRQLKFKL